MSVLTGPIELAGVLVGYAAKSIPVTAAWRDESRRKTMRANNRTVTVEPAYRLVGSFGFEALTAADLAQFNGLTEGAFDLLLRSRRVGDPAWPELVVRVLRTSDFDETGPLYRRDAASGASLFSTTIGFEAVETVPVIPGTIDGGFQVLSESSVTVGGVEWSAYDIEPWGDAALVPGAVDYDVDGVTVTVTEYAPGPDPLVALVLAQSDADPHSYALDTTGTYHLGTSPDA